MGDSPKNDVRSNNNADDAINRYDVPANNINYVEFFSGSVGAGNGIVESDGAGEVASEDVVSNGNPSGNSAPDIKSEALSASVSASTEPAVPAPAKTHSSTADSTTGARVPESLKATPHREAPVERRPRKVMLAGEEFDDQIVELLNKTFMDDPISNILWPDPAVRERGHRAMFYAHLANQRLSPTISSPSATFVNVVVDDIEGSVRAASIWTTPEGPKATLNNFYYGFKYLGFFETIKWAKHFLHDFHGLVGEMFDEIIEIRKKWRRGSGSDPTGDGDDDSAKHSDDWLAFPDFIGADVASRGQGYGTDAMRDALRRIEEAGKTVFILSSNANNLSFYKKHGFQVMIEKAYHGVTLFGLAPLT